jgi:hypothetical protein
MAGLTLRRSGMPTASTRVTPMAMAGRAKAGACNDSKREECWNTADWLEWCTIINSAIELTDPLHFSFNILAIFRKTQKEKVHNLIVNDIQIDGVAFLHQFQRSDNLILFSATILAHCLKLQKLTSTAPVEGTPLYKLSVFEPSLSTATKMFATPAKTLLYVSESEAFVVANFRRRAESAGIITDCCFKRLNLLIWDGAGEKHSLPTTSSAPKRTMFCISASGRGVLLGGCFLNNLIVP